MDSADFLRIFFSEPNKFHLPAIRSGDTEEGQGRILPWVMPLVTSDDAATVLPYWTDSGLRWYGIATTGRQFRRLRDLLRAFVGPTHSDFRGERASLDPSDPVEAAVQAFSGGRAFRFTAATSSDKDLWNALELMRLVLELRPAAAALEEESPSRLLRNFHMAVLNANRDAAEQALGAICQHGFLSAANQLFLRVQLHSSFRDWAAILAMSELPELLHLRRPIAVTHALIQAVYQEEIQGFESSGGADGAKDKFRSSVATGFANLFATHAGLLRSAESAKSFALWAGYVAEPSEILQAAVGSAVEHDYPDDEFLALLWDQVPKTPAPARADGSLSDARQSFMQGEFEVAFEAARVLEVSPEQVQLLLQCVLELGTLESQSVAIDCVQRLPDEQRSRLLKSRLASLAIPNLEETGDKFESLAMPDGWHEWISRLNDGGSWGSALDLAREGASEWPVEAVVGDEQSVERLAQLLQATRDPEADDVLRSALPHFLHWLQRDGRWPRPEAAALYRCALDLLAISSHGAPDDLSVIAENVHALCEIGIGPAEYRDVTEVIGESWSDFASPKRVDWILDVVDALVSYPCPDEEARLRVLVPVVDDVVRFHRHVNPAQVALLKALCLETKQDALEKKLHSEVFEDSQLGTERRPTEKLNVSTVGIHTLIERAARRASNILCEILPQLDVRLNNDSVCTESLQQLAKGADLLVLVTRSAKHAASDCVKVNRPADKVTLTPPGKGSSSIVSAVLEHLGVGYAS